MIRRWFERLGGAPPVRKAVVLAAAALGGVFVAVRLIERATFFGTLMQAFGLAFAAMVVLATAQALLENKDVEETEVAGTRLRFGAARRAVGALERRLDAHTRATDQRLLDLEREVFKESTADSGRQE
jgi:ribulose 1,5-bisphosphate synthetase/thiazole synthase